MCHLLGNYTLSSEWVPGPGCWKGDQLQGLAGAESPTRGGENSSASGLPQSTPCGQSPKAAHYNALDNELTLAKHFPPTTMHLLAISLGLKCPTLCLPRLCQPTPVHCL